LFAECRRRSDSENEPYRAVIPRCDAVDLDLVSAGAREAFEIADASGVLHPSPGDVAKAVVQRTLEALGHPHNFDP
jgi:hypothetical protein